jgi:F0F1-type ATP synthase assembly protein I
MFYKSKRIVGVSQVIKLQLGLGSACSLLVALIMQDFNSILSALLGFALALASTVVYAKVAFAKGKIAYPAHALSSHQKAALLRFLVNMVLFALVFISYPQCKVIELFLTYFVTLSGYWFSLIKS